MLNKNTTQIWARIYINLAQNFKFFDFEEYFLIILILIKKKYYS